MATKWQMNNKVVQTSKKVITFSTALCSSRYRAMIIAFLWDASMRIWSVLRPLRAYLWRWEEWIIIFPLLIMFYWYSSLSSLHYCWIFFWFHCHHSTTLFVYLLRYISICIYMYTYTWLHTYIHTYVYKFIHI
jgi:hypothetical protein